MQVTKETRRVRWCGLVLVWLATATLVWMHTNSIRGYVDLLDSIGLRGAAAEPTPMRRIVPAMYADTQMWVRHALALADGAGPQLRYTHVDNAPFGREVHWDSGFAWLIVGAGWLQHLVTGEPFPTATEQALAWFNFPLLLGVIVFFSIWIARRVGLGGAALVGFAMVANFDFYSGFGPDYVDHHGVLAAAVFGVVLGAIFMGVGFLRPAASSDSLLPTDLKAARSAAVLSAVSGAVGMWVSAATLIPAITIVGGAGALVILGFGSGGKTGRVLDAGIWRRWGGVGAALTFAFYLLEYAPSHLGWRLEVNHPVYALGWWGGSEVIAQLAEWRSGASRIRWGRGLLALVAIAAAPLVIAIGGSKVFVVFDPFVSRLSAHVAEGLSIMAAVRILGWARVTAEIPWLVTLAIFGTALVWRSRREDRPMVVFAGVVLVASLAMAVMQLRWWPSASGAELCVILLGAAALATGRLARYSWGIIGALILVEFVPITVGRISQLNAAVSHRQIDPVDAIQPVYRDIAAALRASDPQGAIVLLASPNASVAVSYYGEFKSIGTLYWENLAGTKAAAEIFSATTEEEARRLILARHITHVAMVSQDNFLAEYFNLLHPDEPPDDLRQTFGYRLLVNQVVPIWLQRIPYEVPANCPGKPERVLLFKVNVASDAAESVFADALAAIDRGDLADAEPKLKRARQLAPDSAEFALIQGHVLLALHQPAPALQSVAAAINHADPAQRLSLCVSEGNRFYMSHSAGEAVQLYRTALAIEFNPDAANNLVWLLSTSTDDAVRNGPEALQLMQRATKNPDSYPYLSAYAAAYAECGQFEQAVVLQQRAVALAEAAKNASLTTTARARLASYEQRKPWRE